MYNIFLDQLLLPVTPEEMKIKHNGRNDTITLINDGEVNILKTGGLKEVFLNCRSPNVQIPICHVPGCVSSGILLSGLLQGIHGKQAARSILS